MTPTGFDTFLRALDADRDRAAVKYESLRARLVKYFEWRNCDRPEDLADVVFDRIVKRIDSGDEIRNVNAFAATVAQFVLKEDYRARAARAGSIEDHPGIEDRAGAGETEENDARMDCLEECLEGFSGEDRRLIIAYHNTDERTMIAARKRLAEIMNISLNTLRIKICRLKAKLEECTLDCCRRAGV